MKKILSIILSLLMMCSMFSTVFAADDTKITDASVDSAIAFKNYAADKNYSFNDNYFFMDYIEVSEKADYFVYEISSDDVAIKGCITMLDDSGADVVQGLVKENVTAGQSQTEITATSSGAYIYSLKSTDKIFPAYFGFAVQNVEDIKSNATVTVNIKAATLVEGDNGADFEINDDKVLATISHEFPAPITFNNENLSALGTVLTNIEFGTTVSYDDVVAALKGYGQATDITNSDKAILEEKLTDDTLAMLAEIIANGNSGKPVTTNSGVVTLPYVALAKAPAVDGTSYVVEAEKVEATEVAPTGKDAVVAYDITIKADDIEVPNPVVEQKVIIDLPNGWSSANVQYKHEGESDWNDAEVSNGKVVFYADSFSVYTLAGTKTVADEDSRADSVKFEIVQDEVNKNKFSLVITPVDSGKQIVKFATAAMEYQFRNDAITEDVMTSFTYTLTPVDGISVTSLEDLEKTDTVIGGFRFVADADDGNLVTTEAGESLKIADLEITGKGNFKVMSQSTKFDGDIMYMETKDDNEAQKVKVMSNIWSGLLNIPEQKYDLTVNVDFGLNRVETTDADYLGMTVTLVGSISKEEKVLRVGEDIVVTMNDVDDTASATGTVNLPANENYTFVIEGLGYRTFRGSVYLDENKTINLWNNAKTSGSVNVIADDDTTAKDVTFLVGDIYMDGIVDIYDLSAATSYYGAENIDKANTNVYACDLNRDGKITIADIAYVQVSYGN